MKKIAFANVEDTREEIVLYPMLWPILFWTRTFQVPFRLTFPNDVTQNKFRGFLKRHLLFIVNFSFFLLCLTVNAATREADLIVNPTTVTGSWNETITKTNYFFKINLTHIILLIVSYFRWPKLSSALQEMFKHRALVGDELNNQVFHVSLVGSFFIGLVKIHTIRKIIK